MRQLNSPNEARRYPETEDWSLAEEPMKRTLQAQWRQTVEERDRDLLRILIVDDEIQVLKVLEIVLKQNGYTCQSARNAQEARVFMQHQDFDLILCDINMPGESGLDLVKYVVQTCPDTAIIMETGLDELETANTALKIGVHDYLIKPFGSNQLMISVANALRQRDLEWRHRKYFQELEGTVRDCTKAHRITLTGLKKLMKEVVNLVGTTFARRDPFTAAHQQRVAVIASEIGAEMGLFRFRTEGIRVAGLVHDLGKISLPFEILSKPGKINAIEFAIIKSHAQLGYEMLKRINFPWPIAQIVYQHHERMDGSGYPQGLSGAEIIVEARILAVADVVEAMASHRPYRPALGIEKALEEISDRKGLLYDPAVVEACLTLFKSKGYRLQEGYLQGPKGFPVRIENFGHMPAETGMA